MKTPSSTPPHILARELSSLKNLSPSERIAALLADQERRWFQGDRVPAEHYRAAVPCLQTEVEALLDLVYNELLLRQQLGEHPTPEEYQRRFPEQANVLRLLVKVHGQTNSA